MRFWLGRAVGAAIVLVILAGVAWYGWSAVAGHAAGRLDVQTAALTRGDVRRVISTSGTVKARITVDVSAELSGQISEMPVDFNTVVKKGDLLARIDPTPFQARIRQLTAAVSIADAGVSMAKAGVDKAAITATTADSDLDRNRKLAMTGAVTTAALETSATADKVAQADLASAQAAVDDANASLTQRQAELESAQIDLDHTAITAPIDGIVIDDEVQVGQTVQTSAVAPKMFTIAQDLSSIDITAQVDESDVAEVAAGDAATFQVDAFPGAVFPATVWQVRIAPLAQQNVVTYTVVMRASNPGNRLLPGMTANLEIVTGERHGVLVAPNQALRFQPRGGALALVKDAPSTTPTPTPATPDASDLVATLQGQLDLDEATVAAIRASLAASAPPRAQPVAVRAPAPSSRAGQAAAASFRAGPLAAGDTQQTALEEALRTNLTADQFAEYEALQAAGATNSPQTGTLWTRASDGSLVRHQVQLGLASLNTTEVVATDIPEGAPIVLATRETTQ